MQVVTINSDTAPDNKYNLHNTPCYNQQLPKGCAVHCIYRLSV